MDIVVSLARRLDAIRFVARRPVRLKGLKKPTARSRSFPNPGYRR
jgi:hypothetical protein